MIKYQAIFFDEKTIENLIERQEEKLPKVPSQMHCTFKYMPNEEEQKKFSELLGKDIKLKVVGYCSDGKNSGFEIELNEELNMVYTNAHTVFENGNEKVKRTIPHITVSMSKEAKAVDTGKLNFLSLEHPFYIWGRAGFLEYNEETGIRRVKYDYL